MHVPGIPRSKPVEVNGQRLMHPNAPKDDGRPFATMKDIPVWLRGKQSAQASESTQGNQDDESRPQSYRKCIIMQENKAREDLLAKGVSIEEADKMARGGGTTGWRPQPLSARVADFEEAQMKPPPGTMHKWAPGEGASSAGNWVPGGFNKMGEGIEPATCLVTGDGDKHEFVPRNALDPSTFPEHENPDFDTASVRKRRVVAPDNPKRSVTGPFEEEEPPMGDLIHNYNERPEAMRVPVSGKGPDEWVERQYAINPLTHRGPVSDEYVPRKEERREIRNADHRGGGLSLREGMQYLNAKGTFPAKTGRRGSKNGSQTHR